MDLIFERGNRDAPLGHALVYFRAASGSILATYVSVPPIKFDLTNFLPGFMAEAMQGMELGNKSVVAPIPPIPEEVTLEYLQALAERRGDDLVYAGAIMQSGSTPMIEAQVAAEAAQVYAELYEGSAAPHQDIPEPPELDSDTPRFQSMSEGERLNELTRLTGRLRDSLGNGGPDADVERQIRLLVDTLPPKYRAESLLEAARTPGRRGQRLAELYLERSYKLYNEEYLDLERLDREIDATLTGP